MHKAKHEPVDKDLVSKRTVYMKFVKKFRGKANNKTFDDMKIDLAWFSTFERELQQVEAEIQTQKGSEQEHERGSNS